MGHLERMIRHFVFLHQETQLGLKKLSEEMRKLKEWTISGSQQKWSELTNRLGTAVEDIIA